MLGPSGCGKSTLLRMIAGLEKPSRGQITIDGRLVENTHPNVLMVWQEFALLDWRTVDGNVSLGLESTGCSAAERRRVVDQVIQLVHLEAFRRHYPTELSGGMKQRVGLARALAMNPDVLLMDEPFGALDAQTRMLMQDEVLRLWGEFRKTIVFVTHSIEEAIVLGDRVAVFSARPGRIKEIVDVNLPRPRPSNVRSSLVFADLYDRLYQLLREEVLKSASLEELALQETRV
jgi:NitT/TauT family transport system ATP-binding protein